MNAIRRILPALVATFVAATVPAVAQTSAPDTGPSLLWVWVWILAAGIIVMIVGTSIGANSNKR